MAVMRPPVDGGTVVVTGASGGIGRELAVQLAARAAVLVLVAPTVERLEQVRDELTAHYPGLRVGVVSGVRPSLNGVHQGAYVPVTARPVLNETPGGAVARGSSMA